MPVQKEGNCDIGVIGLAVMGQNLIMNMNDHHFKVVCFNRTTTKVDTFLQGPAKGTEVEGARSLEEFFGKLKRPRRVMCMIKAGDPVDELIDECLPYLQAGDVFIDGGNSHFPDTERRCNKLKQKGILFVGCGVSGGEVGARFGPSLMPGGNHDAWSHIKDIFQTIAAKTEKGEPCCDWVGSGGAGHYVKMVHNGIEYGDIQIICEAYDLLHRVLGMNEDQLSKIFEKWNRGELNSYLIDVASKVFAYPDTDGTPLVSKILDVAMQKGTGKWTGQSALDEGVPVTLIGEAVFARCLSALKDERVKLSKFFRRHQRLFTGEKADMVEHIRQALYASKIISYTQGYMLMREASKKYNWNLNFGAIALMWQNGCIIRSIFLSKIKEAFDKNRHLENLLFDDFFRLAIEKALPGWRKAVLLGVEHATPTPCFMAALSFFDGITSERLPANLLQAIRDYFGAHTYERSDAERGQFFHTDWAGTGGKASAGSYNA